ncbi:DNA invertase Pin-like site-specific DNA recombinase [Bradyrhizobium sp. USDA 4452]
MREGLEIVEEFYDADVSGADPIETRPGFAALLDRIEDNGVRTVLVEDASRFARQLIVQEAGIIALIARGVRVVTPTGDDLTATGDPFKVAMRQIAGVFAQLEKARLVGKLKAARDRKRAAGTKVEGRKSYAEIDHRDHAGQMIALVRRLRRRRPKGGVGLGTSRLNSLGSALPVRVVSHMPLRRLPVCWRDQDVKSGRKGHDGRGGVSRWGRNA